MARAHRNPPRQDVYSQHVPHSCLLAPGLAAPPRRNAFRQRTANLGLRGNIVSDVHLAALAIEHGLEVCSDDADFARFSEIRWMNPVAPPA